MTKQLSNSRKRQFLFIGILLTILVTWLLAEITVRTFIYYRSQQYPTATTVVAPDLGWKAVPNFSFKGSVPDGKGNLYDLNFTTDENGFRIFGDNRNPDNKRLLVIGDSYTHAIEASNHKTYYGLFQDSLQKVELFAYGARGFGPLQQYLWLQKWYPIIEPDAILWQFCFNDVFNVNYELEHHSYFNNNRRVRPYLVNDEIVYRNPARLGMATLRKYSKFMDLLCTKIEVYLEGKDHKKKMAAEDLVKYRKKDYPAYQEALKTIDSTIKKVKGMVDDGMAILAFPVDDTAPYYEDLTAIFQQNGIPVIKQIPTLIKKAEANGASVWAKDKAHWNEQAHRIASEELWRYLKPILFYPKVKE